MISILTIKRDDYVELENIKKNKKFRNKLFIIHIFEWKFELHIITEHNYE